MRELKVLIIARERKSNRPYVGRRSSTMGLSALDGITHAERSPKSLKKTPSVSMGCIFHPHLLPTCRDLPRTSRKTRGMRCTHGTISQRLGARLQDALRSSLNMTASGATCPRARVLAVVPRPGLASRAGRYRVAERESVARFTGTRAIRTAARSFFVQQRSPLYAFLPAAG